MHCGQKMETFSRKGIAGKMHLSQTFPVLFFLYCGLSSAKNCFNNKLEACFYHEAMSFKIVKIAYMIISLSSMMAHSAKGQLTRVCVRSLGFLFPIKLVLFLFSSPSGHPRWRTTLRAPSPWLWAIQSGFRGG